MRIVGSYCTAEEMKSPRWRDDGKDCGRWIVWAIILSQLANGINSVPRTNGHTNDEVEKRRKGTEKTKRRHSVQKPCFPRSARETLFSIFQNSDLTLANS